MRNWLLCLIPAVFLIVGCGEAPVQNADSTSVKVNSEKPPVFSLAWSEYPSWSVFGVADLKGILNGKEGEQSELEKKYGVDVVLKEGDYDSCLRYYGSNVVDAACITNTDMPVLASKRGTTAIFPTSTSNGADALVAVGVDKIQDLKGKSIYGLEQSVTEYAFVRTLEVAGENPNDYKLSNMQPDAAATGLQTFSPNITAIFVWNPFKMQSLETREGSKVIIDSTTIPGEIIDMVLMGNDSLLKPGGKAFAACLAEAFYKVCKLMDDPATRNDTLVALGSKFSNLPVDKMAVVCTETKFYSTPEQGLAVLNGAALPETMKTVVRVAMDRKWIEVTPTVSYNGQPAYEQQADMVFDSSILESLK